MHTHQTTAPRATRDSAVRWGPIPWRGAAAGAIAASLAMAGWAIWFYGNPAFLVVLLWPSFAPLWALVVALVLRVSRARRPVVTTLLGHLLGAYTWFCFADAIPYDTDIAASRAIILVASTVGVALAEWLIERPSEAKSAIVLIVLLVALGCARYLA